MYTINSIPLDNETYGWSLLRRTQIISGYSKRLQNVEIPGRAGVLPGVPATRGAVSSTLVIRTPGMHVETLYSLFEQNGGVGYLELDDDPTRRATFELGSIESTGITAKDELVNVSVTIRIPTADWRDLTQTSVGPTSVTAPVQTFNLMTGISADIRDMDIVIGGAFGNFELKDLGSGSWLKTVKTWAFAGTNGLLYIGATGQAFRVANSAPWTPLEDVTDMIDVSGGGGFRMTPRTVSGNPSNRRAELQLTTTAQSGVTFRMRGYNAYIMRKGTV